MIAKSFFGDLALMVNTFLVCSSFRLSASKLDYRRLGKQRVEANQILQTIEQYRFLSQIFGIPPFPIEVEVSREERRAWVRKVVDAFKGSGIAGIHLMGRFTLIYPNGHLLPRKPASGNTLKVDPMGTIHEFKGKKLVASGHWGQFVFPGETLLVPQIRIHPAIELWMGFEEALKDYINAHIEEWVSRGYQNTMKRYTVSPHLRPSWCDDLKMHLNFRAALLQKELERGEKDWYVHQIEFVEAWTPFPEHFRQGLSLGIPKGQLLTLGQFPGYLWA